MEAIRDLRGSSTARTHFAASLRRLRALLLEGVSISMRRALRAELICRPLVERLLHSCFEIEANLRMQIADQAGPCHDEMAHAAFERFLDPRSRSIERDLYPREHPAPLMMSRTSSRSQACCE